MKTSLSVITLAIALQCSTIPLQAQVTPAKHPALEKVVKEVKKDSFEGQYRIQNYEPYPKVETTAQKLKTSGYNQFENLQAFSSPLVNTLFMSVTLKRKNHFSSLTLSNCALSILVKNGLMRAIHSNQV